MLDILFYCGHSLIVVALVVNLVYYEIRLEEMQARMNDWLDEQLKSRRGDDE